MESHTKFTPVWKGITLRDNHAILKQIMTKKEKTNPPLTTPRLVHIGELDINLRRQITRAINKDNL